MRARSSRRVRSSSRGRLLRCLITTLFSRRPSAASSGTLITRTRGGLLKSRPRIRSTRAATLPMWSGTPPPGGEPGCSSLNPGWTASEVLSRPTVATRATPAAIATIATTAALASLRGNLRLFDDRRSAVKTTPFGFFDSG